MIKVSPAKDNDSNSPKSKKKVISFAGEPPTPARTDDIHTEYDSSELSDEAR
jgi:hypothetical protein